MSFSYLVDFGFNIVDNLKEPYFVDKNNFIDTLDFFVVDFLIVNLIEKILKVVVRVLIIHLIDQVV